MDLLPLRGSVQEDFVVAHLPQETVLVKHREI